MELSQAKQFVDNVIFKLGGGFHPDTPMNDYTFRDGSRVFSKSVALLYEQKMDDAFEAFQSNDECIYEYSLNQIDRLEI